MSSTPVDKALGKAPSLKDGNREWEAQPEQCLSTSTIAFDFFSIRLVLVNKSTLTECKTRDCEKQKDGKTLLQHFLWKDKKTKTHRGDMNSPKSTWWVPADTGHR